MRRASALVIVLAALFLVWGARADTPLPPRTERFVYDQAGVVEPADEEALEALHRELFDKTGVAIVIVTVVALQDETIADLAVRIGQSWGVGRKGEDRGLVVAFSRDDRDVYVATGYGTEGYLPDGKVGALLDAEAIPAFRAGRFSDGLRRLCDSLARASADEYGVKLTGAPPAPAPERRRPLGRVGTILGWAVMLALAFLLARRPGLFALLLFSGLGRGGGGFGGGGGSGGFGGGGFGGGGAGRSF